MVKKFIKNELLGWRAGEVAWLVFTVLFITVVSIYCGDTTVGIISAATGVMYTVLNGKGKLSAYFFGLINCVLYAWISYEAAYYGETMLNGLYYVPMQFVGFYVWSRNMDPDTHTVTKRHMSGKSRVIMLVSIAVCTVLYGFFLRALHDTMPFVDSFTTVTSVIAMVVAVRMYSEQWWLWGGVNLMSVYMWWVNYSSGSGNIATLLMWAVYLINSVVLCLQWERDIRIQNSLKEKMPDA